MVEQATQQEASGSQRPLAGDGGRTRRHWHPLVNAGLVVAVLGLVFTVGTYWVGQRAQARADERQARGALTEVTRELASLPRSYAPLLANATGFDRTDLGSAMSAETVVLIAQAETIVSETPGIVRAQDYFALGDAYLRLGNYDLSYKNYTLAERLSNSRSGDYLMLLAARRGQATSLFPLGEPEQGSKEFELVLRGLDVRTIPDSVALAGEFFTLASWARAAAVSGHCEYAAMPLSRLNELRTPSNQREVLDVARWVRRLCG